MLKDGNGKSSQLKLDASGEADEKPTEETKREKPGKAADHRAALKAIYAHKNAKPVKITPEMAAAVLARTEEWRSKMGRKQRSIRGRVVAKYVRDIVSGRWDLNGEPIIFDDDAHALNGRHRLTACVRAGKPIDSYIVTGIDGERISSMDGGAGRTLAQKLAMERDVSNGTAYQSMSTVLMAFERGPFSYESPAPTYAEMEAVFDRHHKSIEWAYSAIGYRIEPGNASGGACVLAPFAFAYPINRERVDELARQFKTGEGLKSGDPMSLLRRAVVRDVPSLHQFRERIAMSLRVLKCIDAGLSGDTYQRIPHTDESIVEHFRQMRAKARSGKR